MVAAGTNAAKPPNASSAPIRKLMQKSCAKWLVRRIGLTQRPAAMKNKLFSLISLLTLVSVLAVPTVKAEDAAKEKPVGKKTLAKYDADKDGKLNEAEKAARDADKMKAKSERKAKKDAEKASASGDTK